MLHTKGQHDPRFQAGCWKTASLPLVTAAASDHVQKTAILTLSPTPGFFGVFV